MFDVEFKKKEYSEEMRKMKRTIIILVGVFIVLICFSAYVLRIKSTRNDFSVVHFNQGQYKGGFSEDKWPQKPEEDNSLDVLQPGRVDDGHRRPNVKVDPGVGRNGGGQYGHIHDDFGDRARGRMHHTEPKTQRPVSVLNTTPYNPGIPTSSVPTTEDESSNRDYSQENNKVQTDVESKPGALSNIRSKLEHLAKDSGLNVAGLIAKLLGLTGSKESTSNPTSIPLLETNTPISVDNNRNPDPKAHSTEGQFMYVYDRNGVKRKFYFADEPLRDDDQNGDRINDDISKDNRDRFRDRDWEEGGFDRRGKDKDGYYRNKGSSKEEIESDRRYDDNNDHQFGRRRGHFHRPNLNEPEFDDDYNNARNDERHGGYRDRNPLNPDSDTSGNRKEQERDKSEQENTGSGRNTSIPNANRDEEKRVNITQIYNKTNDENIQQDSIPRDRAGNVEANGKSKEKQGPLYVTRQMIKKRIQNLLKQQKLAKPGDTSIAQSISLLQATLDSIEWELKNSKHKWGEVDVNDNTRNVISSTSYQPKQIISPLETTTHATTMPYSASASASVNTDGNSSSTTTATTTQSVHGTTTAQSEETITQVVSKSARVKSYTGSTDISSDDIDLKDWSGSNRIIFRILRQLKEDPTKVDVYDMRKRVRSPYECVALRTVSPHAVICINNPRLDKPLSASLKVVGLWENAEVEMFKSVLRSNHSYQVIDLGSTLGVFTITAAAMGRSVVAVEPLPMNIAPFHKSVIANSFSLKHITLVTNAITDYHGIAELIYRPYGNLADVRTSALSLKDLSRFSGNVHDLVRTITLDDLSNVVPFRSAVMKIDIQGDEYVIFKRANQFFDKVDIPYIFMHWIPTENKSGSKDIASFLTEHGYRAKTALDDDYLTEDQLSLDHDIIVWIKQSVTSESEE